MTAPHQSIFPSTYYTAKLHGWAIDPVVAVEDVEDKQYRFKVRDEEEKSQKQLPPQNNICLLGLQNTPSPYVARQPHVLENWILEGKR